MSATPAAAAAAAPKQNGTAKSSPAKGKQPKTDTAAATKDDKKKGSDKFASNTRQLYADATKSVPKGQLKPFDSTTMADAYQPQEVESAWDAWWEHNKLFAPLEDSNAETFVMVIPPPNVTGVLHIGHALTLAVQDSLTRWHRMSGKNTLWIPGSDHAGIATQVVVEKRIAREQQKTRHDLGRPAFLEEVWKWQKVNGASIYEQFRRLGISTDWQREAFTMNDKLSAAVKEAFIRLHRKGAIYRSNRIVNWSCTLRTAISNLEVEYTELDGATKLSVPGYAQPIEFGVIHSFAYKVADAQGNATDEEIVVATTRIETMLGDVAVAVHPQDERYKHLHGKHLVHPFLPDRKVVIVTDDVLVDMNFGTGAVKVTPAHDPNDFNCGKRHSLPEINIFTDDGRINHHGGEFEGHMRFAARQAVIDALTQRGLFRGKANNKMSIGVCSRSKDIVEPVVRPQWWMNCSNAAGKAVEAARSGELKFIPENHTKVWYHWLENIQDWCISRQLWWGHRIPAYFVTLKSQKHPADGGDGEYWVVAETEEAAKEEAAKRFNVDESEVTVQQDEDVLDTWFSAGLFPFSTLGWPDVNGSDFQRYFPTSLLETGHDILFFWVARMVMMSIELCDGQLPFKEVYLHAMIRDKQGRKMSKSLGNVIDPLDVIYGIGLDELHQKLQGGNLDPREVAKATEGQTQQFPNGIAECGADALRFGLLAYTSQGRDINLDIQRVVAYRQFGNKLWQVTRFAIKYFNDNPSFKPSANTSELTQRLQQHSGTNANYYILHQIYTTVARVSQSWKAYEFADVTQAIYNFWLYELCDVFIECIKPVMYGDNAEQKNASLDVLHLCLDTGLKLLHPMMPFITEELWHRIPSPINTPVAHFSSQQKQCHSIMIQQYPTAKAFKQFNNPQLDREYQTIVKEVIKTSRSIRSDLNLTKQRLPLHVTCADSETYKVVRDSALDIATLGSATEVIAYDLSQNQQHQIENSLSVVVNPQISVHAPLESLADVGVLLVKMEKDVVKLQAGVEGLKRQMSVPGYEQKVKPDAQAKNTAKLEADTTELQRTEAFLKRLFSALSHQQYDAYWHSKIDDRQSQLTFLTNKTQTLTKPLNEDRSKWPAKTRTKIEEIESDAKVAEKERDEITQQYEQWKQRSKA